MGKAAENEHVRRRAGDGARALVTSYSGPTTWLAEEFRNVQAAPDSLLAG